LNTLTVKRAIVRAANSAERQHVIDHVCYVPGRCAVAGDVDDERGKIDAGHVGDRRQRPAPSADAAPQVDQPPPGPQPAGGVDRRLHQPEPGGRLVGDLLAKLIAVVPILRTIVIFAKLLAVGVGYSIAPLFPGAAGPARMLRDRSVDLQSQRPLRLCGSIAFPTDRCVFCAIRTLLFTVMDLRSR
jgi:hypothetical protein